MIFLRPLYVGMAGAPILSHWVWRSLLSIISLDGDGLTEGKKFLLVGGDHDQPTRLKIGLSAFGYQVEVVERLLDTKGALKGRRCHRFYRTCNDHASIRRHDRWMCFWPHICLKGHGIIQSRTSWMLFQASESWFTGFVKAALLAVLATKHLACRAPMYSSSVRQSLSCRNRN